LAWGFGDAAKKAVTVWFGSKNPIWLWISIHLVGGWAYPSEEYMSSSVGMIIFRYSQCIGKKNVPNHQPNNVNLGLIKPWFINRGPKWKIVIHHDFEGHSNCTIDHGLLIRGWHLTYGDGSKPWYLVNPKIAGKWMFIPLKMVLIGIDPYPYQRFHHKSQFA
jgi:hypothetical protein